MGHINEKEELVELGETYIDENQKERVWRCGPAPEIPILYLQLIKYLFKYFNLNLATFF